MADYWNYYNNKEFRDKVKLEMQSAAIAVMAELAAVDGHALRITYAESILAGSASLKEFSIGVLTNATIQGHITAGTDYTSDLAFVTSSLFNAFAGVSN